MYCPIVKMKLSKYILSLLILLLSMSLHAQFKKENFSLYGHVQELNTVWIQDFDEEWMTMSSVYNRLNFKWYVNDQFTFTVNARNMFNFGQMVYNFNQLDEYYNTLIIADPGYLNMTGPIAKNDAFILYSNVDRLSMNFTRGKWDVTIGRQRINWGINMLWNANDIFNTFSFFDFDYVERPGCDATRIQYYTGPASRLEMAIKIDSAENITAGALYQFNLSGYDFQLIAGKMISDLVIGGGWSGNIKNIGFTGEFSYFHDQQNFADTSGVWLLSVGFNYMFSNSLFVNVGVLYNSLGKKGDAGWGASPLTLNNLTPKTLSNGRLELFSQLSYPLSPIIQADLSGIYNPYDHSYFVGPGISFSISDNMSFLVMSQVFQGKAGTEYGGFGSMLFSRIKWSF